MKSRAVVLLALLTPVAVGASQEATRRERDSLRQGYDDDHLRGEN